MERISASDDLGYRSLAQYAVLSLTALFVFFYQLGASPIFLWDEARVTINSLEMMQAKNPLVVTYHGEPDLWSTKPPAAIWLFALSMKVFGISEWSLRLPSAIAGLLTAIVVFFFVKRISSSQVTATLSALILMGTVGYIGTHGTRSADFDSVLVLFLTIATFSAFLALEKLELCSALDSRWVYVALLSLSAAVLTKGVAGVLLIPGVGAYIIARGQLVPVLRSSSTWIGCGVLIAIIAGFYGARESAQPGYLAAVWANELGGRFGGVIEGHQHPWHYYLSTFLSPGWLLWMFRPVVDEPYFASAFPWSWALPFALIAGLRSDSRSVRRACLLVLLCTTSYLLIISFGATKLPWYLAPTYPLTAVAVALGTREIWILLQRAHNNMNWLPYASLVVALSFASAVVFKNMRTAEAAPNLPDQDVNSFVRHVFARFPLLDHVRVIHDGHGSVLKVVKGTVNGSQPYSAPEEFYVAALSSRGLDVGLRRSTYSASAGEMIIWCRGGVRVAPKVFGRILHRRGPCVAVSSL